MTKSEFQKEDIFPIGEENIGFAQYFTGNPLFMARQDQSEIFVVKFLQKYISL